MYIYIYIYIYQYINISTYEYIYIYIYIHIHIYTYIYIYCYINFLCVYFYIFITAYINGSSLARYFSLYIIKSVNIYISALCMDIYCKVRGEEITRRGRMRRHGGEYAGREVGREGGKGLGGRDGAIPSNNRSPLPVQLLAFGGIQATDLDPLASLELLFHWVGLVLVIFIILARVGVLAVLGLFLACRRGFFLFPAT